MKKKALVFSGGWEGHEPIEVGQFLSQQLREEGYEVSTETTLDVLEEYVLTDFDLIVPNWTQGQIEESQLKPLLEAVEKGTGLAGLHGGMGDSFRMAVDYQFMVGGQWVAHPGNDLVEYEVDIVDENHHLTAGMKTFKVKSEQYYMHVDPAANVHATTKFPLVDGPHAVNGEVHMPVVWSKQWGKGRVYYCSLGHSLEIVKQEEVQKLMKKGMLWATRS
ncbi:ThuA domain-containing protein [Alkalihalobacillus trypoxylicola]|uniref:ThuA-like domain-containing protein n=1 Tax=Alkalihalobacillus trypoxylicola TaxID=519424 RepID=A0A162EEF1_9BACI|nr:ThuA domain-containing protein [Alkalihalobacillus trypoxylicola]KYG32379.1 hypothetical protein AZF04_06350 [Alkalihalobacillus trypoxylicola]